MRLWQKIFLLTLGLVITVVNATSLVLLSNNHRLSIEREQADTLSRHQSLVVEMQNLIIYTQLAERVISLDEDATLSVVFEVLNRGRDNTAFGVSLYQDGKLCYAVNQDQRALEQQLALLQLPDYSSRIIDIEKGTYLLLVSTIELSGASYQLVTSTDITSTYAVFRADLDLVRVVGVVSALLVAGVLLLLARGLLNPLASLSTTTRRIAAGDLDRRATVKGHDEVADVAQNFNSMADAIERNVTKLADLAETRRVFMGNLAHEMKTPLTSILGFADILRIKRDVSEEERQEYAGLIVGEARRLQGLSGKLMELLTLGNVQPELETIDLGVFSQNLTLVLQPLFERAQVRFCNNTKPLTFCADTELLTSLLYNLIDNALKASKPGSTVSLGMSEHAGGSFSLIISDEGSGIPADQIALLTEPFFMLDKARTRKHGGAGLGLALCAEIARVHNAELEIKSILGQGTQVHIHFTAASRVAKHG